MKVLVSEKRKHFNISIGGYDVAVLKPVIHCLVACNAVYSGKMLLTLWVYVFTSFYFFSGGERYLRALPVPRLYSVERQGIRK
jgi:hypothetical protein